MRRIAIPLVAEQTLAVHVDAPPKPTVGAPCNGCGLCCLAEPCPLGMLVSRKRRGGCAALRWVDTESRYRCGMVSDAASVMGPRWRWLAPLTQRLARRWISAGSGCDADLAVVGVAADTGGPVEPKARHD